LEVYLALRSAVGEIEGGEDYSSKAEESMGLFCERMSISLVSFNDSSLEDLVPNDLHRGGMEELLEQSLQKWKYNLEEWKRDNEELPTTDQAQIWRLLHAATDGNCFDVHGIYGPDSTTLRGEERLLTRGCCSGRGELVNHLSSKEREEKRRKLKYTMSRKLY
jgi:hypothetical protein